MELSTDDLMIIKDMFLNYWETYRPEGDQTALYERILDQLCPEKAPHRVEGN